MILGLRQRNAIIAAVVGMWFLSALGVFIAMRVCHWSFVFSGDRVLNALQLGGFYGAFFGSQLLAIAFVAFIVSRSAFRHPVLVSALVVFSYQMVWFAIRLTRGTWSRVGDVEWWMPVGFELAGIVVLVILAMAMAWMLGMVNKARRTP